MRSNDEIMRAVKKFLLEEVLHDHNADEITTKTHLVSGGLIDSIAVLRLAGFIEEEFNIEVQSSVISVDKLDTLSAIADFVQSKLTA